MNLMPRVRAILREPRATWPVIAAERADARSIFIGYVMVLAAIPALAGFIGLSLVGVPGLRVPVAIGLGHMLVSWLLTLVPVWVVAWIVDALAPAFGGTRDRLAALKLVAYGSTASFLGGVFNLVPMLAILGLLVALYSIYLIYTGLPVLMQCPPAKAGVYTAAVIVCGIIAMLVLGAVAAVISPMTRLQPAVSGSAMTLPAPVERQPAKPTLTP
jgi:hypothetical protein